MCQFVSGVCKMDVLQMDLIQGFLLNETWCLAALHVTKTKTANLNGAFWRNKKEASIVFNPSPSLTTWKTETGRSKNCPQHNVSHLQLALMSNVWVAYVNIYCSL
jgi:hypothetical protein